MNNEEAYNTLKTVHGNGDMEIIRKAILHLGSKIEGLEND